MAACSGCGAAMAGNFCSSCGAPATNAGLAPILLDATGPQIESSGDRVRSSSHGRNIVFALAIFALLIGGGVALSQSPDTKSDSAASEVSLDPVATTETTQARTTLREAESAPAPTTPTTIDDDTLLGTPTGWFVVVQSANGIARIDVDTGEVEDLGLDGVLLGEAWGRVLIRRLNGDLSTVELTELGGELPVETSGDTDGGALGSNSRVMPGSRPGLAWLVADYNRTAWQVDVTSGAIIRTVDLDEPSWFDLSPDFVTPLAGGIYALQDDDSYQWSLDGRVIAEAPGRILVRRCDESLTCENQWLSPDTFEELPQFFLPSFEADGWFPSVLQGGRFLTDGPRGLIDSETGEHYVLANADQEGVWDRRFSISPDGQVIALTLSTGKLRLRLVGESDGHIVDTSSASRFGVPPIFVPRPTG